MRAALAGLALAWAGLAATSASAAPCDRLAEIALPANVRIVKATSVTPVGEVNYCRVEGVIETEIGFELWLPENWNGRFLGAGVGGQAGQVNSRELTRGVRRGYAVASTDTGHKASDRHWLLGDPARAANYAHRANHLLAVTGKAITAGYYARAVRTALFIGCSGGGRQGLTEVQRYPHDYDGVLVGAPGPKTPEMSARRMWEMVQHSAAAGVLSDKDWQRIAAAAVKACDRDDGLIDGVIGDPARCRFRPADLSCAVREAAGCLSPAQTALATKIYAPLHDEKRRRIDDGLLPGVRVQPAQLPEPFTPGPPYLAVALFGDGVHRDANWDARGFRLADDLPAIDRVMDLHADDPDVRPFVARGGKLMIYQGLADPLVAAQPTIAYHRAMQAKLGSAKAAAATRLYLVPNMEHCVGGDATDRFGGAGGDGLSRDPGHDMLSALEAWVEQGRAPGTIIAAKMDGARVARTRPLCPFPAQPRYVGKGDPNSAASFTCR